MAAGADVKQRQRSLAIVLAAAAATLLGGIAVAVPGAPPAAGKGRISLGSSNEWRSGDLIFRHGTGLEAAAVGALDDSGYTHVGLLVRRGDKWNVIHVAPSGPGSSSGGRVEEVSVEHFANADRATAMAVFRAAGDGAQRAAAVAFAEQHLGVPFDDGYRYSDDDAIYCTELVAKAFATAGIAIADWRNAVRPPLADEAILRPADLIRSGALAKVS